jgi:cardiolipin synthase
VAIAGACKYSRAMTLALVPNLITLGRIGLVPVLILAMHAGEAALALAVFLVAGVSDALDGFIAKRFHLESRLGAILDPAADKLLLVTAYVMLAMIGDIPFWLMLAVVCRDLFIVGGYLVYTSMYGPVRMRPSLLSKLNTFLQLALVFLVLARDALDLDIAAWIAVLVYAVLVSTIASGAHYLWSWIIRREVESEKGDAS